MPKPTINTTRSNILPLGWVIVGLVAIAGIGLWRNHESNLTPTPVPITSNNWQKVTDTRAVFSTAVILARNKTFVLLPLRFEQNLETVWLTYDSTSSAEPSQLLISHPSLLNLKWNRLDKGVIHLYQKNKTYASIDEFLARPPEKSKLMIDNGLFQITPYKNLAANELSDKPDLTTIDYILTTYIPLIEKNNTYTYENTIDASGAIISSSNTMSWMVFNPKASTTNPYYLGEIHIDYRR